jgi:hypothetical protein
MLSAAICFGYGVVALDCLPLPPMAILRLFFWRSSGFNSGA